MRLAAVRKLAEEASDNGFLTGDIAAQIHGRIRDWTTAADITEGSLFRTVRKGGANLFVSTAPRVVYDIVRTMCDILDKVQGRR